jgi:hypothetical protein
LQGVRFRIQHRLGTPQSFANTAFTLSDRRRVSAFNSSSPDDPPKPAITIAAFKLGCVATSARKVALFRSLSVASAPAVAGAVATAFAFFAFFGTLDSPYCFIWLP